MTTLGASGRGSAKQPIKGLTIENGTAVRPIVASRYYFSDALNSVQSSYQNYVETFQNVVNIIDVLMRDRIRMGGSVEGTVRLTERSLRIWRHARHSIVEGYIAVTQVIV